MPHALNSGRKKIENSLSAYYSSSFHKIALIKKATRISI